MTTTRRRATALMLSPVVAVTTALALASPASAAIGAGPVAPLNGSSFPSYYEDASGLQLKPCLNALHCAATTAADVTNPDGEFFYNLVEGNVGPFLAVIGLEGAYIDVGTGQEMVFNRLRFRAREGTVKANTDYTIVHPYGTSHVKSNADGSARITDDDGCEVAPCDFGLAMPGDAFSPYTRFLTSVGDDGADGFMDNDGVAGPIKGSPTGNNFVKIYEGTTASGTPVFSETNFTVQAAVAAPGTNPPPQPQPATEPDRVAKPVATAGVRGGLITASVDWVAPANGGSPLESYTVQARRVTANGLVTERQQIVPASQTEIVDMQLPQIGRYRFRVMATNGVGNSPFSPLSNPVRGR